MTTITIDPNYGYVLLAASASVLLNTIHGFNVGSYRKAAAIPYPAAYAPSSRTDNEAHAFNCAQRAHANYIENQPSFLAALLLAGVRFPLTSAGLGAGWCVARWLYMKGYSNGKAGDGGKGRYKGIWFWFAQLGLLGLTAYSGVQMVLGN